MNEEKKKITPTEVVQIFEQYETFLEQLAMAAGAYYKSLVANGIPEGLAQLLVVNWQDSALNQFKRQG